MFVLVAGGGRTGTQLARLLLDQNHQVRVIEHRRDVLMRMHHDLPTEVIYEGDATEIDVLELAGLAKAQVLAACTASDADNLVICYLARKIFKVPRNIARINNPRNAWLFDQKFAVDVALNHSEVMAKLIEEQMSLGDMMTLLKLRKGDYSLVEEKIPDGARAVGAVLRDLPIPENSVIAAIIRDGKIIVPRGVTVFQPGDEVLAVTDRKGAEQLAYLFSAPVLQPDGSRG